MKLNFRALLPAIALTIGLCFTLASAKETERPAAPGK